MMAAASRFRCDPLMMQSNDFAFAAHRPTLRDRLLGFIMNPWVDKSIAVLAAFPFIYPIVHHFQRFGYNLPDVVYVIQSTLLVGTMVFRRPPVRVTTNPFFWVLAFIATYWGFLTVGLSDQGQRIAPVWLLDAITLLSLVGIFWARLSLGRNIGFVPAQREIVTRGAYRFVRHPIYSVIFLSILGEAMQRCSVRNLILLGLNVLIWMVKSVIEEGLLRQDPQYAAYMRRVRWRWIPWVA